MIRRNRVDIAEKLSPPVSRSALQRLSAASPAALNTIQEWFTKPHANWIHLTFEKQRRP